ncbi:MAG: RepB family plasmid replication initiator protein [Candidatus Pacebacteria bacterium]|nr:RepB family plasmid replication initiator protein [Candidatus Paceibacterota bacterium]
MEIQIRPSDQRHVVKYTGAIHIANTLSLLERKTSNILLRNAQEELQKENTDVHYYPLADFKKDLEYNSNNMGLIREALLGLVKTTLQWNILGTDKKHSQGYSSFLSEAFIVDHNGAKYIRYAYSPMMRELFISPELYSRIDLATQSLITRKTTQALWEYLIDLMGRDRRESFATEWLPVPKLRELLVGDTQKYPQFKKFTEKVLFPAMKEVAALPEFKEVSVEYKREKMFVKEVRFFITPAINTDREQIGIIEANSEIIEMLCNKYISYKVATEFEKKYTLQHIKANIDYVESKYNEEQIKAPLYIKAIEDNYANYSVQEQKTDESAKNQKVEFPENKEWEHIKDQLKEQISQSDYKNWLRHIQCENFEGDQIKLHAPTEFIAQYAVRNFLQKIESLFEKEYKRKIEIEITH